jgi:hypothetical protein
MDEQLQARLEELRSEFDSGQRLLADLAQREMNIRQSLLRISGAIQVLEELIERDGSYEPLPAGT